MNLVYDIEADNLELRKITKVHCICIMDADTEEEYVYVDNPDSGVTNIVDGVSLLAAADCLIAHNQIHYDLPVLRKLYNFIPSGKIIDTLLLSRLINPDRTRPFNYAGKAGPHSIEVWGHRIGREPKIQIEEWSCLTPDMLKRCQEDVRVNWAVYKELYKEALV